jgi:hypothetical protein
MQMNSTSFGHYVASAFDVLIAFSAPPLLLLLPPCR